MLSNASIDVAFHDTDIISSKIIFSVHSTLNNPGIAGVNYNNFTFNGDNYLHNAEMIYNSIIKYIYYICISIWENIFIFSPAACCGLYIFILFLIKEKNINNNQLILNKKIKTFSLNIDKINSNKDLYKHIEDIYPNGVGPNNTIKIVDYIEQFFVGLLEGNGTITVDYISDKKKRIRIIIALKLLEENIKMIDLLVKYIGGRRSIDRNNKYITWIASSRTDLTKVFIILAKYPLLTTNKLCQLDFAKEFIKNNTYMSKNEFIKLRNEKYLNQPNLVSIFNEKFVTPYYFQGWLSGFIEAEGHFKLIKRLKTNGLDNSQFIIGKNNDSYILKAINIYLENEKSKISSVVNKKLDGDIYYKIHVSNKHSRTKLNNHFKLYPLLGYKYSQYMWWYINQ